MKEHTYYINGKFMSSKNAKISFDDGGFQRGNAIFETIRFNDKHLFSVDNHMERLRKGVNYLGFELKKTKEELVALILQTIDCNSLKSGVIKLMITNNFDINNPFESKLNIYISIRPIKKLARKPVKIIFLNEWDFPIMRFKNSIKINSYAGNIKALMFAKRNHAFDAVFLNRNKIITEATMRNIFFIKEDTILTPPLSLGILPGTTRGLILKLCKEHGYDYREKTIKFKDIKEMDEAFLTSSSYGIIPCYWDNWTNQNIKIKELKKILDTELSKE